MKPEAIQQGARYQLTASVARFLRVPVQTVIVLRRDSVQTFGCRMADGTVESIAADDLREVPEPCGVLDAGPI